MTGRRFEIGIIVASGLLIAAVLAGLSFTGSTGRRVREGTRVRELTAPHLAIAAWSEEGVHGRVLVHFDRQIRADSLEGGVSDENYVYQAAEMNLIRKIYHVVPDSSWPDVRSALSGMPSAGHATGSQDRKPH